jgi:oxygen-independent coproporphyrinogen-3 oxidase
LTDPAQTWVDPGSDVGLYVHWPYCARICPYCDFNVVRDRGRVEEQGRLVEAILADLRAQRALTGPRRLASVFFGGGTPSLMAPEAVARIIDQARDLFPPSGPIEISLEANPTDSRGAAVRVWVDATALEILGGATTSTSAATLPDARETADSLARSAEAFPLLAADFHLDAVRALLLAGADAKPCTPRSHLLACLPALPLSRSMRSLASRLSATSRWARQPT